MVSLNWFECKVSVVRDVDGVRKKVDEIYVVDALTFTNAESRIIDEVAALFPDEFTLKNISPVVYNEIFINDDDLADKWYKLKYSTLLVDEDAGKEKRVAITVLVQAASVRGALDRFEEGMRGSLADYEVMSIQDTKIMDVLPFNANDLKSGEEKSNEEDANDGNDQADAQPAE